MRCQSGNFECLYDVIYEAENALCDINKHHLQLINCVKIYRILDILFY
jgi:hypothetical protein